MAGPGDEAPQFDSASSKRSPAIRGPVVWIRAEQERAEKERQRANPLEADLVRLKAAQANRSGKKR